MKQASVIISLLLLAGCGAHLPPPIASHIQAIAANYPIEIGAAPPTVAGDPQGETTRTIYLLPTGALTSVSEMACEMPYPGRFAVEAEQVDAAEVGKGERVYVVPAPGVTLMVGRTLSAKRSANYPIDVKIATDDGRAGMICPWQYGDLTGIPAAGALPASLPGN